MLRVKIISDLSGSKIISCSYGHREVKDCLDQINIVKTFEYYPGGTQESELLLQGNMIDNYQISISFNYSSGKSATIYINNINTEYDDYNYRLGKIDGFSSIDLTDN
ncbi:17967_t:CDS:1, partial [Racocetra fulgida]